MPLFDVVKTHRTPSRTCVLLFLAILLLPPRPGLAQDAPPPSLPSGWITPTPKGLVAEPDPLRKLVGTSETIVSDEKEPADGVYVEVSDQTLRDLYGLLNWAPTSANAAPERFAFLRSKEAKTLEGDL